MRNHLEDNATKAELSLTQTRRRIKAALPEAFAVMEKQLSSADLRERVDAAKFIIDKGVPKLTPKSDPIIFPKSLGGLPITQKAHAVVEAVALGSIALEDGEKIMGMISKAGQLESLLLREDVEGLFELLGRFGRGEVDGEMMANEMEQSRTKSYP